MRDKDRKATGSESGIAKRWAAMYHRGVSSRDLDDNQRTIFRFLRKSYAPRSLDSICGRVGGGREQVEHGDNFAR